MEAQNHGIVLACSQCGQENRVPFAKLTRRAHCAVCRSVVREAGTTVELSSSSEYSSLVTYSDVPVLVHFWAPWCGLCAVMSPQLERIAKVHGRELIVAKVNVDEAPTLASRFSVRAIPTLILVEHQREVSRTVGMQTYSQLQALLQAHSQHAA